MTNDNIINKCIILSPGYSSPYTLAINLFAWGSHHSSKQEQNQKCWRTYNIHTTLCIKMPEVKCKILLSVEIIMSYFRTFGEAAGFLLPPLISKSFLKSWRPKKDRQIQWTFKFSGKPVEETEEQCFNLVHKRQGPITNGDSFTWDSFLMAQDTNLSLQRESIICFPVCYHRL